MNAGFAEERFDPRRIAPDVATELLARAPWRRFVVLGDDCALGPGGPHEGPGGAPWSDRVAAALRSVRPELAYLNLARPRSTATEVRARQLAGALTFRADLAAVAAGGNDVLSDHFDADATETELARIIGPLRDGGVDVVVLAPFGGRGGAARPPGDGDVLSRRLRLLTERTRALALRHGAIHVGLGTRPAGADPDVHGGDGRPADARGHALAAAAVIRRLGAHLGVPGPPSHR
ncbi:GDSL-type esterase/lipase family protein [Streptomyces sp. NPDC047974]|uniref:GDSL-type esterase/lipase family protein n=1 Tax=Streptomyces sp. NPDC047974 TaxID=3154343 RepID=UPI0033D59C50